MLAVLVAIAPVLDLGLSGGAIGRENVSMRAVGGISAAIGAEEGAWQAVARLDRDYRSHAVTHVTGEAVWSGSLFMLGVGAGVQILEAGFFEPYYPDSWVNFAVRLVAGVRRDRFSFVVTPIAAFHSDPNLCAAGAGGCSGSTLRLDPGVLARLSFRVF